ncbi:MAG: plasmid recombination protein [Ruminococcus flavefaciens]|nr:plasmid recombination protein [Ruminococcus flavefaciens]
MMGKGSVSHNTRTFSAKNVDVERSRHNIEFCHSDIKEVYHKLFDEALERYNTKQKRNDRKIDDYYEKIRQGKQEKLFHEVIFQIGNKDDTNAKNDEGQLAREILIVFMDDFQKRNPNLYVFSAHLHMDEETPHIHIDFVPFIRNSQRGLDTRVTLKGALAKQGFKGGTRSATEWNQWIESEKQELSKVADRYGVQWKQLGTHNKHLSVLDFEKQERAKEVAELEQTISGSKAELSHVIYQQVLAEEETEKVKQENEAVRQETAKLSATNDLLRKQADGLLNDREKLLSDNQALEEQQKRLQKEVEIMADSKTALERNIHTYDEGVKWQLPEPSALMSAKTYRDKHAMPLVTKLKEIVKGLTIKCVNLMDQVKQLKAKVTKQAEDIEFYKDKIHQQSSKLENLQEKADDFERVKQYVGADKIDTIVINARELERIAQNRNQHNRVYGISR